MEGTICCFVGVLLPILIILSVAGDQQKREEPDPNKRPYIDYNVIVNFLLAVLVIVGGLALLVVLVARR